MKIINIFCVLITINERLRKKEMKVKLLPSALMRTSFERSLWIEYVVIFVLLEIFFGGKVSGIQLKTLHFPGSILVLWDVIFSEKFIKHIFLLGHVKLVQLNAWVILSSVFSTQWKCPLPLEAYTWLKNTLLLLFLKILCKCDVSLILFCNHCHNILNFMLLKIEEYSINLPISPIAVMIHVLPGGVHSEISK